MAGEVLHDGASIGARVATLRLRTTFAIAHGASDERRVVVVTARGARGPCGAGEGAPVAYLGDSLEGALRYVDDHRAAAVDLAARDTFEVADVGLALPPTGSAAGRAALEVALLDLEARRRGVSLRALIGAPAHAAGVVTTSFTLPMATPDVLARLARDARAFAVLKLKLAGGGDLDPLDVVRAERPDARLRLDPNGSWGERDVVELERRLARDVDLAGALELVEQPFGGLGSPLVERLRRALGGVPIVADEAVRDVATVALAARSHDGVNVKVQKVGGVIAALACLREARARGLRTLLGCMIESTLGIAGAAALAGLATWADLDGPLLIANDPYEGVTVGGDGAIELRDAPGHGASARPSARG